MVPKVYTWYTQLRLGAGVGGGRGGVCRGVPLTGATRSVVKVIMWLRFWDDDVFVINWSVSCLMGSLVDLKFFYWLVG